MSVFTRIVMLVLISTGPVQTGRIVGGHVAALDSRPYMALVVRHVNEKDDYCGAFLVDEEFVMTAAHCQAPSYTVKLGRHSEGGSKAVQIFSVVQSFPFEGFNNVTLKNDIMLLKLSSKVQLTKHVAKIKLADKNDNKLPQSCSVCGWGTDNCKDGFLSSVLKEVNVSLIDEPPPNEDCRAYWSEGVTGGGKGDSGGPLVCEDGLAYGVVSHRHFACEKHQVNYFAKIPGYRHWVDKIIWGK